MLKPDDSKVVLWLKMLELAVMAFAGMLTCSATTFFTVTTGGAYRPIGDE